LNLKKNEKIKQFMQFCTGSDSFGVFFSKA
jgi:hypothetical protein